MTALFDTLDKLPPATQIVLVLVVAWLSAGFWCYVVRRRYSRCGCERESVTEIPDAHGDDGLHPDCFVHDLPAAHRLCANNPENSGPKAA